MIKKTAWSKYAILIICLILVVFRIIIPPENVLSWDVFGYYLYLPAKFIYRDLALINQEWLTHLIDKYETTATLYQAVKMPNGNWVIKYTMGLAILFAPFFFIAHLLAGILDYPADGFSLPYQYSITMGAIVYLLVGLIYFRKILLHFFNERTTILLILIIVFGTNYFQLAVSGGILLSHIFLFTLYAILIWYTIRWHKKAKPKYALIIGITMGFIFLIRPSEIVCVLIPILWNIKDERSLFEKLDLLKSNYAHVLLALLFIIITGTPQLVYWKLITGKFLFYSYTNAGEGFEFLSPYTFDFLFSFRKGWFIYTPIMIFSMVGFYHLYKNNRFIFFATLIFFLFDLWIISSWSTWWYAGGSFSSRSLVPAYTVLALPLGYFIEHIKRKSFLTITILSFLGTFCVLLNLFQTWQFDKGIISGQRMTRAYYFAIFGKTTVSEADKKLLLVERSVETYEYLRNETGYNKRMLCNYDFEENQNKNPKTHSGSGSFKMDERVQSSLITGLEEYYKVKLKTVGYHIVYKVDTKTPLSFRSPSSSRDNHANSFHNNFQI